MKGRLGEERNPRTGKESQNTQKPSEKKKQKNTLPKTWQQIFGLHHRKTQIYKAQKKHTNKQHTTTKTFQQRNAKTRNRRMSHEKQTSPQRKGKRKQEQWNGVRNKRNCGWWTEKEVKEPK